MLHLFNGGKNPMIYGLSNANSSSAPRSVARGVPRGSVLGPLLLNILIYNLEEKTKIVACKNVQMVHKLADGQAARGAGCLYRWTDIAC